MQDEPSTAYQGRAALMDRPIGRRRFAQWLAASLALSGSRSSELLAAMSEDGPVHAASPRKLRVAAVQMSPKLGDVEANLAQAEQLVREAIRQGAECIVLPELFTTAAAYHEDMIRAIRPLSGAPAQFLADSAREAGVALGGSFLAADGLAADGGRVHNSFLLAFPDGTTYRHDKDFPTYWETCYYQGGQDDGVLQTALGPVGVALCWEMVRSDTAKRLSGKVGLLLAGSTWWTLPNDAPADHPLRAVNLAMLKESPPRLARMLGVPVVHASHAGPFAGFDSPELSRRALRLRLPRRDRHHRRVRQPVGALGARRRCGCDHGGHRAAGRSRPVGTDPRAFLAAGADAPGMEGRMAPLVPEGRGLLQDRHLALRRDR